ncbi:hypothetical protein [Vannielia sp. SX4]|uniref:hypothetical protein n=1 Tax=Vannielia sp. SX4 TaxID=3463852 RepID=UPI004058987D
MLGKITLPLAFLTSLAVTPLAMVLATPPGDGPALVIVPPWDDADALLARAGGRPIGPRRAPFAVLARFPSPAAAHEARTHGAWAVLGGGALAALCGVSDA